MRLLILLLIAFWLPAGQAQTESYGPYQIHYGAFPSAQLEESIAREYGIQRSRIRGVLTVVLTHEGKPTHGMVRVVATDSKGEDVPVEVRRIVDGEHISYLGTFRIEHGEALSFTLEINPLGGEQLLHAAFRQRFFNP